MASNTTMANITTSPDTRLLLLTLLRLSPVATSAIGATFSYSFGVFFGGFRAPPPAEPDNNISNKIDKKTTSTTTSSTASSKTSTTIMTPPPAAAKWAAMPYWFRSVRARGLRTIFFAYNSSILLGIANTVLFWTTTTTTASPSLSSSSSSSSSFIFSDPSRTAYLLGTTFSVAYYLYTFYYGLVPMNLQLADGSRPVAEREAAERRLARYDVVRTCATGGPAMASFFAAALLWVASSLGGSGSGGGGGWGSAAAV